MSIVALIPARKNSKRLPGKNLKMLGGKPLIKWTIRAALDSGVYDHIFVCTDDLKVNQIAYEYGVGGVIRNPAADNQPDIEWVQEVFYDLAASMRPSDGQPDQFSILRPTSPFRDAALIRVAYMTWMGLRNGCDSMRAMRKVSEHPFKMWDEDGDPFYQDTNDWCPALKSQPWNEPSQSFRSLYIQTAGMEWAWTRVLEQGSISGDRVAPFVLSGPAALDINTEEDWWVAERYLAEGRVKFPGA